MRLKYEAKHNFKERQHRKHIERQHRKHIDNGKF